MTITILGEPKGQPRPRAYARKMGAKYVARVYDSDVADVWKRAVDDVLRRELSNAPASEHGAFQVLLSFAMPRPKSHLRSNGEIKPNAPKAHTQKPDADNLAKLVLDRMTNSAKIWRDDSQVSHLSVSKTWAYSEANAGVYVCVQLLD